MTPGIHRDDLAHELLSPGDGAKVLDVSRQTFATWRELPGFPSPVARIGGRSVPVYLRSDIESWAGNRERPR